MSRSQTTIVNSMDHGRKASRLLHLLLSSVTGLFILLLFSYLLSPARNPTVATPAQISPELIAFAAQNPDSIPLLLYLEPIPLPTTNPDVPSLAQRTILVNHLQQRTQVAQRSLLSQLLTWEKSGAIINLRPFWIVNAVAVEISPSILDQIASHPDIRQIVLDTPFQLLDPDQIAAQPCPTTSCITSLPITTPWGLAAINAPSVWHGLGLTGTGVVVANMDTGVDFTHPELAASYRGWGEADPHTGNWFDAINGETVPLDPFGHGTHVMGTMVGRNIGIAPGAQWIAIRIFDQYGFTTDSAIHAGFQWALAPDGNPALAPDILNNSWGTAGIIKNHEADVAALQAAGIIPVFAAGNSGPSSGSIGAPASYTNTLAVGAQRENNDLAWFSSRGPSPLNSRIQPQLIAPGTMILSALTGGGYALYNGTSMAAPHVAGAIALLKQAAPTLPEINLIQILTQTAVPIGNPLPNMSSGWGRLDLYAAAAKIAPSGILQGQVKLGSQPLTSQLVTVTTPSGNEIPLFTDANGWYTASLQTALYQIDVAPFGYLPQTAVSIPVTINNTTQYDFYLTAKPTTTVQLQLIDLRTNTAVSGTIILNPGGLQFNLSNTLLTTVLPAGNYTATSQLNGFRNETASLTFLPADTVSHTFYLTTAPRILLVNSGSWYFNPGIEAYKSTIAASAYTVDLWEIENPQNGSPTAADLAQYDLVVWAAIRDAPSFVGADLSLLDYLKKEGNLLIAGPNIAYYDDEAFPGQWWWHEQLDAEYLGKAAQPYILNGNSNTPFAGISVTLNYTAPFGTLAAPDQTEPDSGSMTQSGFTYADGRSGALLSGHCKSHRMIYWGFGLDQIKDENSRDALWQGAMSYFSAPPVAAGYQFLEPPLFEFAVPSIPLTVSLPLQNLSELITETLSLTTKSSWPLTIINNNLTIGSCATEDVKLLITPPLGLSPGTTHTVILTATGNTTGAVTVYSITQQIPNRILLVDDDRWYDKQAEYAAALNLLNLPYDIWEMDDNNSRRNQLPLNLLQEYEIVIWYTGYDWFRPINHYDREIIYNYLQGGGRIFLNSADYLYYNFYHPLTSDYLGVLAYQEPVTATALYGQPETGLPAQLAGPSPLTYPPYQNFSDGLLWRNHATPLLWENNGYAGGTAVTHGKSRVIFWAVPWETVPVTERNQSMEEIVGWLSDLGGSQINVDALRAAGPDITRTYTITINNNRSDISVTTWISNPLPMELTLLTGTISGGAIYNSSDHTLNWSAQLLPGESHLIQYQARLTTSLPLGTAIYNPVHFYEPRLGLHFTRTIPHWRDPLPLAEMAPQLPKTMIQNGSTTSMTLILFHPGTVTTTVPLTITLFGPYTGSLNLMSTTGITNYLQNGSNFTGTIDLLPGSQISLTWQLSAPTDLNGRLAPILLFLSDPYSAVQVTPVEITFEPYKIHYPFIAKTGN